MVLYYSFVCYYYMKLLFVLIDVLCLDRKEEEYVEGDPTDGLAGFFDLYPVVGVDDIVFVLFPGVMIP